MSPLQHILRQAQRRALLNHALHRVGLGAAAGAAAAIVLLLFDRFTAIPVPPIGYWLLPAAGIAGGAIHTLLALPDRFALAVQLDRVLRLKDRIGTAATLAHLRTRPSIDPEFAELVDRDAQRLAETVDVRAATPIRATRIWALLVPLAGAFIAGYLWLPQVNLFESKAQARAAVQRQQFVQVEAQQIASTIDQTIADLPRDEALDDAARSQLEALDRLAQQLAEQPHAPEDLAKARDESAAHLNELADRLAQQSQRELAAAQEIARRFEGMDKTGAPTPPMSAQEFSEALTRGDFGEAAKHLQELLDDQSLPDSQRQQAADHLRDLASHIEKELAQMTPEQLQQMRQQLEQALRDQGVDEQTIQQLMENPPPQQLEQQLQQHDVDEDVARQLARDIERHQQQREIEEQTQRDAQQVQDALRKAAEQLDQPDKRQRDRTDSPDVPVPDEQRPETRDQTQRDQSQHQQQQQQPKPGESPSQQQRDQAQPAPSQSSEQREQRQADKQGAQQQEGEQRQPSSAQPQPTPSAQPDSKQTPAPEPSAAGSSETERRSPSKDQPQREPATSESQREQSPQPDPTSSPQTDRLAPDSASGPDQQPRPDSQQTQPQSQQQQQRQQQSQSQNQQQQQPPQTPSEALRRLAERQGTAEDRRQASERMKQAARELSQRMTPEERERWAQQWRRQQGEAQDQPPQPFGAASPDQFTSEARRPDGSPDQPRPPRFQTDDLDLRDAKTADQIIAQWQGDEAPADGAAQPTQSAPPAVRQAREVAERAVNEAAVQKRYHRAIQRYFGRLNETASKAAGEPSARPE